MSKHKYPRISGRRGTPKRKTILCSACEAPATLFVTIQWNYMRGDDDVLPACAGHAGMNARELAKAAHAENQRRRGGET